MSAYDASLAGAGFGHEAAPCGFIEKPGDMVVAHNERTLTNRSFIRNKALRFLTEQERSRRAERVAASRHIGVARPRTCPHILLRALSINGAQIR